MTTHMSALSESNQQDLWDSLDERLQARWAGNTDPWAGPCDPAAVARELAAFKRTRNPREARADHADSTCCCGMGDCAYCGAVRADGQRPSRDGLLRFWRSAR